MHSALNRTNRDRYPGVLPTENKNNNMTRLEKQLEVIEMYKATFAKVGFETDDINFTNIDPKLINRLGQTCATYLREQENRIK